MGYYKNHCSKQIQRAWRYYTNNKMVNDIKSYITDKVYCCICFDAHTTFNRCTNGHGVCDFCYDSLEESTCPMCRNVLSEVNETTVCNIASKLKITFDLFFFKNKKFKLKI